jgi:hypothetical protein
MMTKPIIAMSRSVELDADKMKELGKQVADLFAEPMKALKKIITKETVTHPVEMSEVIHSHLTGVIMYLAPGAELEVNTLIGYKLLSCITTVVDSKAALSKELKSEVDDQPNYFG